MKPSEELSEFMAKMERFIAENVPSWLTPNSYFYGVVPGHNLDLLQVGFDFKIDRRWILSKDDSDFLIDPSKPQLTVVK